MWSVIESATGYQVLRPGLPSFHVSKIPTLPIPVLTVRHLVPHWQIRHWKIPKDSKLWKSFSAISSPASFFDRHLSSSPFSSWPGPVGHRPAEKKSKSIEKKPKGLAFWLHVLVAHKLRELSWESHQRSKVLQLNLLNYNLEGMVHQTWTPWIDKKRDKVDPDKSLGLYM